MIRTTRFAFLMIAATSIAANAQTPPRPARVITPPAPPAPVVPAPMPAPAARVVVPPGVNYVDVDAARARGPGAYRIENGEIVRLDMEAQRAAVEAVRDQQQAINEAAREGQRAAMDAVRDQQQAINEAAREAAREVTRNGVYAARPYAMPQVAPQVVPTPYNGALIRGQDGYLFPTSPRYQNDPADSLWRSANALISQNDYRAAAQRFRDLQQKYPNSRYFQNAMYWQAFALYRSDTDNELREAVRILQDFIAKYPNARIQGENNSVADAQGLTNRIRGRLAARGDATARQQLNQSTDRTLSCDKEEQQIRTQALSSLMRVDPDAALPKLEQVLGRRDECLEDFRRQILGILVSRGDERAVNVLLTTARQDPSPRMRSDAIEFVSRYPSENVLNLLESAAKNDSNMAIRRTAARSLVGYPSPRAAQIVRALVEDNTSTENARCENGNGNVWCGSPNMRCEILNRYSEDRGSAEDAAWMRTSYPRITNTSVRLCMVRAIGRIGGTDNQKWMMDLSVSENETAEVRSEAFTRVSANMSVADLGRAYDNAGNRPMRQRIVQMLNKRKEPEALDKLIDIVKKSSDLQVRQEVIQLLASRKDPKVTAMLLDLIDNRAADR